MVNIPVGLCRNSFERDLVNIFHLLALPGFDSFFRRLINPNQTLVYYPERIVNRVKENYRTWNDHFLL